jgi:hypothetical protein
VGGLLLLIALPAAGQSAGAQSPASESVAPGTRSAHQWLSHDRVLFVDQESPGWPGYYKVPEGLLRHFTPNLTRIADDEYAAGQLFRYDRVVVVGADPDRPLPSALLEDVVRADRPVLWLGYGLDRLPVDMAATYGFSLGEVTDEDLPGSVEYHGQSYRAKPSDYYPVFTAPGSSARRLATYYGGQTPVPYVVRGGNDLWFVNGLPELRGEYPDPATDAPGLIFADALHDFFGTPPTAARRQAVIRFEDTSVHIPPARLAAAVDLMVEKRIPFAIGVIPAQRLKDGTILGLREVPEFVRVLRYAQDNGATIVLHGYHHTFGTGEDYEFWDPVRNAPLEGETWDLYASKIEDGIRILRNNGIEPRMWETTHYAGSPLAYRVFSHYFSHAIENRNEESWLPYPSGPDEYGQVLIPENLGHIDPEASRRRESVEAQLERARLLGIVRDSWAVGFYHPAVVPAEELGPLVSGLQRQGYTFADLRALPTEVRSDYRPDRLAKFITWWKVDLSVGVAQIDARLTSQLGWWPTVRDFPWLSALVAGAVLVFVVRLPAQWRQQVRGSPVSLVEQPGRGFSKRRVIRSTLGLAAVAIVAGGLWVAVDSLVFNQGELPYDPGKDRLRGWSSLDWTVVYDGYGEVGVEGRSASLEPAAPQKPVETHAALALAGDPKWRDYDFTIRMNLEKQLRQNSPPNDWEAGWLMFRYQGEGRSYYLAHKPNGLELGKLVPPAGTGQVFLATAPEVPADPGRWHDYRIELRGANIKVYVDDELQIDYTDPDPILSGRVGLYTEDAKVLYRRPEVSEMAPAR